MSAPHRFRLRELGLVDARLLSKRHVQRRKIAFLSSQSENLVRSIRHKQSDEKRQTNQNHFHPKGGHNSKDGT